MAVARATAAFEFIKGEDVQIDWTIYTDAAQTTPATITGWGLALVIKRRSSDAGETQIAATSAVVSGAGGTALSSIDAADSVLADGDYDFDFWRTDTGSKTCLASGTIAFIDTPTN